MKRIVSLSLMVMCLPLLGMAQSFEDDLYYTPKKESTSSAAKKESAPEVRKTGSAETRDFVPSGTTVVVRDRKGNVRDVDEYNRRYDSRDNEFLVEGDTLVIQEKSEPDRGEWVNGFNGSEDDYEYATRLVRFRNPRYAIPVSSPLYWDVVYGVNSWDWNVYDDGFYAYSFPTYTNRLWWDWRFGSFGVTWGFPYYSGYWGWGGYYPGYWGWGGHWGHPHYGWHYPWYGHNYWSSPLYNTRPAVGSRPGYSSRPSASSRPGYTSRPSSSSRPSTGRVVGTRQSSRPGVSSSTSRPGVGTSTTRPSTTPSYTRPSTTRPSGSSSTTSRSSSTRRSSSTYNPSESSTRSSSGYNRGSGSSRSSSSYGSGRSSSSSRSSTPSRSYTPSRSSSSSRSSSFSSGSSSRSSGSYSGGGSSRSSGGGSSRSGSSRR